MPIYGKRSHLGITYQQSFDQIPDFTSSAQMIPNVRHNIAVNRPHIIQENMRGIYDEGESYRGPHEVTGEIESEAHPITMGYLFDAFFGDATVTTSDNIYTHEWTPNSTPFDGTGGSSFKRPFGLIQQGVVVAGGATVNYYYNLVANTLELSVAEGELLKTRMTYMGGTDGENTDSYTATYQTSTERFSWDMCTLDSGERIEWTERTTALTGSSPDASDFFGRGCAISKDGLVLAVGASGWDGGGGSDQGIVYIFDWNGSSWTQRGTVVASDAGATDYFGRSCALSGDGAILSVGSYNWDGGGGGDQGAVYIYDWNGSAWVERSTILTASDAGTSDLFGIGCALSSDGTILAVGAYAWDGSFTNMGAVYIFDWSGSAWVERSTILTASDAAANVYYGASCALSSDGTVLAVGASSREGSAGSDQGAVYIHDWDGSAWVERSTIITASDAGIEDYFGYSCALSSDGSVLAVGSIGWDGGAGASQGAVYIYDWNGASWDERTTTLTPSDAENSDTFGSGCALSGDAAILAVGANNWDSLTNQGAMYVFDKNEIESHSISEFNVTFEDPIEPKYYLNTSVWPAKNVLAGRRKISFSGTMHYENNSYYQHFLDKDDMKIQLTLEDTATEIQSGYYNKMHLTLYKARIETVEANATGAGETMLSFSGNAHYSPVQAGNMTLTLTNTKSAY